MTNTARSRSAIFPSPIVSADAVDDVANAIDDAGIFGLDLEFMTEGRYVPELSLVQVAWGDIADPNVAAIDPLKVNIDPILDLIDDPQIATVIHSAQADLALLGAHYQVRAGALVDTQIAAAFLGAGDQLGYGTLVQRITGIELDKGAQFTEWSRRPLSEEQIAYALDDVRYLQRIWDQLQAELIEHDRLAWVRDECDRLAEGWSRRTPPEEMYKRIRGWNSLKRKQLGALRAVSAWREEESLDHNRPPGWLLNDRTLLELCRRSPQDESGLREIRGMGSSTVDRYGQEIIELIRSGIDDPPEKPEKPLRVPNVGQAWTAIISGIVQTRCHAAAIATRFVATRSDIEDVITWWLIGDKDIEPEIPLLNSWRRDVAGQDILDWLSGDTMIAVDQSKMGITIIPRSQ